MSSNNPPYVTLELDEHEAEMLQRLLTRDRAMVGMDFREVCEMSSSDPRSIHRSSASLALAGDMSFDEDISGRITDQQSDLTEKTADYANLIDRKVSEDWKLRERKI